MAAVIACAILVGMASSVKVVGTASAPLRTMESSVAAKIVGHASIRLSSKKIVCHRHAANASTATSDTTALVMHLAQVRMGNATRKATAREVSASASMDGLAMPASSKLFARFTAVKNALVTESALSVFVSAKRDG